MFNGYIQFCDSCDWVAYSETELSAVTTADNHMTNNIGHDVYQSDEGKQY